MRILVLSNLYPPNVVGGYERLCFEVTSGLAEAGHDMVVLTSRYGGKVADYPKQRILRLWDLLAGADIYTPFAGTADDRAAINEANRLTLLRVLAEQRPDVVFAWNLFFLDASLLDVLQQSGIRTVVMLTDNWLLVMRNPLFVHSYFQDVVFGDAAPPAPAAPATQPGFLQRVKAFFFSKPTPEAPRNGLEAVFGSAFMRDFYAAGGAQFARHAVIHNGVRQGSYGDLQPPDRSRLVEPGVLRLLFAGRLVDLKGAHTAVSALALLDAAALGVDRVVLTLLGDAQDKPYMAQLQAAIEGSGRQHDIELRPSVPEDALPALFDAHDIYLFPSLYEPFSLTLIHALALGIPTVASATGGNVEIVQDGESGVLFRKGDAQHLATAITRLATDGGLRVRLADGGSRAARRFTFERMVAEMGAFLSPPA
jgi:glycosyltransferase involved in cell wall biosynthesis